MPNLQKVSHGSMFSISKRCQNRGGHSKIILFIKIIEYLLWQRYHRMFLSTRMFGFDFSATLYYTLDGESPSKTNLVIAQTYY